MKESPWDFYAREHAANVADTAETLRDARNALLGLEADGHAKGRDVAGMTRRLTKLARELEAVADTIVPNFPEGAAP